MKIYLDLPNVSQIGDAHLLRSTEVMAKAGGNTGNLVFRHALAKMVDLSDYVVADYPKLKQLLDERARIGHVVISAANWIGCSDNFEAQSKFRADLLLRSDCPITIVGLGAQSKNSAAALDLGSQTRRLLNVLSGRTSCIGVRDVLTAETLEKHGVKNFSITGCPSNFINLDARLGHSIREKCKVGRASTGWSGLRTQITEATGGHELSIAILRNALEHIDLYGAFYVCQSDELLAFLYGEDRTLPENYTAARPPHFSSQDHLASVLVTSSLAFTCAAGWLDFARSCQISFGMRIHGNMVAVQAAVPSLLIAHDSRTEGLAAAMQVPAVTPEKFLKLYRLGPRGVFDAIDRRMLEFDATRRALANKFNEIFKSSGLRARPEFQHFLSAKSESQLAPQPCSSYQ